MSETEGTSTVNEEEKTPQPRESSYGRPPLRLWFSLTREVGRSNLSLSHPLGLVPGITGKFYSTRETCQGKPDFEAVNKAYDSGPKQKFSGFNPPLESHKYGWYSGVSFTDVDILRDRRINYHKRTSPMFKMPTVVNK
ncbi:uncharacterized protein LOC142329715 isoform X2 [Lycorma delicatula]